MLEKPDIQDSTIIDSLQNEYGLDIVRVAFLPLGVDRDTAVYRAVTDTADACFVKLRRGNFDEMTIIIPTFLHELGIKQIIAPLLTRSQKLWTGPGEFTLTVSPFVEGHAGYEVNLSDQPWIDFGHALNRIHTAVVPSALADRIQREFYSNRWRVMGKRLNG